MRSLNRAEIIGNVTADPELRSTPRGVQVCSFSIATNRDWKTESGEQRQETQYHKCVAWDKLAELSAKMLQKGKRVYVEGRIHTRSYDSKDGTPRSATEIIVDDLIVLDQRELQIEQLRGGE